jgi:TolB protein
MMRRFLPVICALAGMAALGASSGSVPDDAVTSTVYQSPQDLVISLNSVAAHPKLGLPNFIVPAGDPELQQAATTVADVLWNDLDFENDYYMISRKSSATVPITDSVDALPYERWTELGADIVILGSARRAEGGFQVDIRIIGVKGRAAKQQIFGAKYSGAGCSLKNPRSCAHFMSDDIHKQTRALDGVARTKLVFTSDRDAERLVGRQLQNPGPAHEIYISDYDGANQQRITANRSINLGASWSPDGQSLAYTSYVSGFQDIYISNLFNGRAPSRPAAGTDSIKNMLPAWSPDGTRLAFASYQHEDWDIWVMNRDGTGMRNLTNKPGAIDNAPTWSPNGTQIAFTSDRTGSNQIYVIGVDGVGLEKLTSGAHVDRPTWSPAPFNDIAYTVGVGPTYDVSVVDVATKQVIVLTDGVGSNESPSFAPNGRHIVFKTTRWGGKEQLAIVGRDGKALRRITDVGNNNYPNWSRSPQ